jgi:S1-C subfamily serine protease
MLRTLPLAVLLLHGCSETLRDTSRAAPASGAPTPEAPLEQASAPRPDPDQVTPRVPSVSAHALIEDERNTIAVFEAAQAATVYVTQKRVVRDWSRGAIEVPSGSGTGFVWDDRGHVVTNAHVVDGGRAFTITLHDGRTFEATLRGVEPLKDIAVLRMESPPDDLVAIRLPEKGRELRVGQKAIAIGNPFGLDNTLTVGVISALGRDVEGFGGVTIRDMVQTDASINPGNSGGPLLDSAGRLMGMNTMIFSRSGASAGIGFAVPTRHIRRIVPQIIATGRPQRVGIGVSLLPDGTTARMGIRGIGIRAVVPDSPAAQAGLQGLRQGPRGILLGDVIVAVDGEPVQDFDDLYNQLDPREPGDVVRVTVVRDGRSREVEVPLYVLE